jgi:hypothetical protein
MEYFDSDEAALQYDRNHLFHVGVSDESTKVEASNLKTQ